MQNLLYHFYFKYVCRACKWTHQKGENSVLCFFCMFDFSEKRVIKHSLLGGKKQSLLTSQESTLQGRSSTLARWRLGLWQAKGPKKAAGLAESWYQAFCSIKLDYLSVFNQLWKCMILDVKCKGKCSLLGKDKNGMKSNDPNQTWGAFFSKSFFWDNKFKKNFLK